MQIEGMDDTRVLAEIEADAKVIHLLREQGDRASVPRPIDLRFVGTYQNIEKVRIAAAEFAGLKYRR